MKYLMLFVDNFEDTEAISTMDVLKRGKDEVVGVSLMERIDIQAKFGFKIHVDKLINEVNLEEFDALIIPGGPGSFLIMPKLQIVTDLINYFAKRNKLVASICAAPHLVGRLGYFKDLNYTVHPGFENQIIG
nr:DJ-1/PfpI family protein [Acholeplasmatales bacterium]